MIINGMIIMNEIYIDDYFLTIILTDIDNCNMKDNSSYPISKKIFVYVYFVYCMMNILFCEI